ncbi:MAG: nucleotide exchange factor GrpE [Alphaproteobacteria bacterium]|uniref:nucleotide exchange factor GrpE n=1 Tax=Hyphomonas sp. TaxID=87 RepID=UPI001DA47B75|nr:nucleotide exchange factor GrpE [Alphaproteobacteria bacterium]MBU2142892.1 nucleotide exchange factor GrpE [Alphaproteobacteria bacterium]MBU2196600.1 nucleotide exchange factor GrpE [Alphaproteobacteria bacterium]
MSDETKNGNSADIDPNASKADLKAAADAMLKNARAQAAETMEAEADSEISPEQEAMRLKIERDELREQLLRTLADLDNTRKRAERQISEARVYAIERFAGDLLSVSDNLARALAALPDDDRANLSDAGNNLLSGIEMTAKELETALGRHGVKPIDAVPGAVFDPNLHQAVAQIPSDQPSGTIASVFQPGWKIGERTLRAAMVAVSAGGAN